MTNKDFLTRWAAALQNRNPGVMTGLYAPNAVLLATLAAQPLVGQQAIFPYFAKLMETDGLAVRYDDLLPIAGPPMVSSALGIVAGLYTFMLPAPTPARFTFVFRADGRILHHHSSASP